MFLWLSFLVFITESHILFLIRAKDYQWMKLVQRYQSYLVQLHCYFLLIRRSRLYLCLSLKDSDSSEYSNKVWHGSTFCSQLNKVLSPNPFDRPHAVFMLEVTGIKGQYLQLRNQFLYNCHFHLFLQFCQIQSYGISYIYRFPISFSLLKQQSR